MAYTFIQSLRISVFKLTEKKNKTNNNNNNRQSYITLIWEHHLNILQRRGKGVLFFSRGDRGGGGYRVDCLGQIGGAVIKGLHFLKNIFEVISF